MAEIDPNETTEEKLARFWLLSGMPDLVQNLKALENLSETFEIVGLPLGASIGLPLPDDVIPEAESTGSVKLIDRLTGDAKDWGMTPDNQIALEKLLKEYMPDWPFGKLIRRIFVFVSNFLVLMPAFQALGKLAGYKVNRLVKPNILSLNDYLVNTWRTGDTNLWREGAATLGISPALMTQFERSQRPYFDLNSLGRLAARYGWTETRFSAEVKALGWDTTGKTRKGVKIGSALWGLTRQPIDMASLMELRRRGILDPKAFNMRQRLTGFRDDENVLLSQLVEGIPDVTEVIEGWRRGQYKWGDAKTRLKAKGFTDKRIDDWKELRHSLPNLGQLLDWFHRGLMNEADLRFQLKRIGLSEIDSELTVKAHNLLPAPTDIIRFAVRDIWEPDVAKKFDLYEEFPPELGELGKKVGYSQESLEQYWAAHWVLPAAGQGYDMYYRGIITYNDLNELLIALDYSKFWRARMMRLSARLIPRRTLPKLVRQGLFDFEAVVKRFHNLGFARLDAEVLAESTVKDAEQGDKDLTKGELLDAYARRVITQAELKSSLAEMRYSAQAIEYQLIRAEEKRRRLDLTKQAKEIDEDTKEARELTKSDVLRFFRQGLIDRKTAEGFLDTIGFSVEALTYLLNHAELTQVSEDQELRASQVKQLYMAELIRDVDVTGQMVTAGFTQPQASRQLVLWQRERYTKWALDKVRKRRPSRTDLADWLKKGVFGVPDWVDGMEELGYRDRDINNYLLEMVADLEG